MQRDKDRDSESLQYVVGEEKKLPDVLGGPEAGVLLKRSLAAGAEAAAVILPDGEVFLECGRGDPCAGVCIRHDLVLEGEAVGTLTLCGRREGEPGLRAISCLLKDALEAMMNNNLKRVLTTEVHTRVLELSYQELVEANAALKESEGKYRTLSEHLEEEVRERTRELQDAYARMLQDQKMSAVGQLAAGLAHEINNPIGFVKANLGSLLKYSDRIREMLDFYRAARGESAAAAFDPAGAEQKWRELKLGFILGDMPDLILQCLEGSERVQKIISDLMGFSGIYADSETWLDINGEIDRTLHMMSGQIPADAEVVREYASLPGFLMSPPLFCQVMYNIILNAIQSRAKGLKVIIGTAPLEGHLRISVEDNGPGIPPEIGERVFEPFFTTREVGRGQGLGLTIAYNIIRKYGGSIRTGSSREGGSGIVVELPMGEV
jgi:two-component system, NtrC family, sensor kinase